MKRPPWANECIHQGVAAAATDDTYGESEPANRMAPASTGASERDRKQAILVSLRAGNSAALTVKLLKISKATVYRVARQWKLSQENSYTGERKKHERNRPKRTQKLLQSVENRLNQDHHSSCRKLAAEFNVGDRTMRRVIHEDLKRKTLKPKVR